MCVCVCVEAGQYYIELLEVSVRRSFLCSNTLRYSHVKKRVFGNRIMESF